MGHSLDTASDFLYTALVTKANESCKKVVVYPQTKDFPLTPAPELEDILPTVYAKLKDGREWTVEAEEEFLQLMLP